MSVRILLVVVGDVWGGGRYIQHPVPVKPLGGEKPDEPLKLFLTKKERKRIRRSARQEREQEKRDKMLMGLIPAPEPKFKLSNFMKILGDQAVADPSKVEKRVMQQMQQRQLNHEMRNQAAKLTPAERKEKKRKKLQEDTSRQVHVAIFRVENFSDPKHRFKVDVNIQQLNLTGTGTMDVAKMIGDALARPHVWCGCVQRFCVQVTRPTW
jgi:U4/U6 small nuclear ribonucleoprotein PRP3